MEEAPVCEAKNEGGKVSCPAVRPPAAPGVDPLPPDNEGPADGVPLPLLLTLTLTLTLWLLLWLLLLPLWL